MIIGVAGKIGAGKDTVGDICVHHYGMSKKAFALNVKKIASTMTDTPLNQVMAREWKNKTLPGLPYTGGRLLQTIGQGYRDIFYPNIWIDLLFKDYEKHASWVITDVRYANEVAEIHKRGGIVLYVEGDPQGLRAKETRDLNHASEQGLVGVEFDAVINNNGTIEQLEEQVIAIVDKLTSKAAH